MELKWTGKALSDLARLYEVLAPVNKLAAARTVQALAAAPSSLQVNPRIGERLDEFEPREVRRILDGVPGLKFFDFSDRDVVRHPLVGKIVAAYDRADREKKSATVEQVGNGNPT